MKYRRFGRSDWMASILGFGAMRLPVVGGDMRQIDEPEAMRMIKYAIDHGVNYIDTAYMYHGGNSEILIGKILSEGYRGKVKVATKMPIGMVRSRDELDKIFEEQMRRLQVDRIDLYLMHGVDRDRWRRILDLDVLDWAERKIDEGRIGYLGFSFHDEFEVFKEVVDGYSGWTFCQIQYNYLDVESSRRSPGTKGLRYAASRGLAVVVMEPIRGGLLALPPPPEVKAVFDETGVKRTSAQWALLWVWSHPEVSVVLSGMSTFEQVVENVATASIAEPGILSEDDLRIIEKVRGMHLKYGFIGCTGCRYCIPCPRGVEIPAILRYMNRLLMAETGEERKIVEEYHREVPEDRRADRCARCGECEKKCPQRLPIRELIRRSAFMFRPPPT
ncbi:MAG: aldo/keto reductase [Candidatus Bathyarchaeia archaeon]